MKSILSALSEQNRLHIVEILRNGPHTVGELVEKTGLRQPQVSKHLRVLSDAGIVHVQPIANRRVYHLHQEAFKELDDWLDSFRYLWEERFNQLDDYLLQLQSKEEKDH
ncbi:ArsR/SmtB family transcription factor [Cytobacillus purgationiresistens]|uniref:DNA-binding transcriptional ArsR family regulator n=1 Tax=Cytobacillus purgationiresistens TaxID=863449 RepID=A0ABU0AKU5_9BACI|nr:metalloregulator ArsR/SmtB family transcription factor [Cytobacillus purgationiresistens]MDQ0271402.1 DNA-binding transcriptional ArsR family regulator [Cytobacillus purgationiresistens]